MAAEGTMMAEAAVNIRMIRPLIESVSASVRVEIDAVHPNRAARLT